jgi:hypothetical protein
MLPVNAARLRKEIALGFASEARTAEGRVTLGRLMPEGLRLRRDARGRLFRHYGLAVLEELAGQGAVQSGSGARFANFRRRRALRRAARVEAGRWTSVRR